MATNYHDTGYKELFSHPEFVQQLIEEKFEDVCQWPFILTHLLKTRVTTPVGGLPPVFPIVLYNGSTSVAKWDLLIKTARQAWRGFLRC